MGLSAGAHDNLQRMACAGSYVYAGRQLGYAEAFAACGHELTGSVVEAGDALRAADSLAAEGE